MECLGCEQELELMSNYLWYHVDAPHADDCECKCCEDGICLCCHGKETPDGPLIKRD